MLACSSVGVLNHGQASPLTGTPQNTNLTLTVILTITGGRGLLSGGFVWNYGLFAPKTIRSRERKFQVWNFRSRERMVLGAKSPVPFVWTVGQERSQPSTRKPPML